MPGRASLIDIDDPGAAGIVEAVATAAEGLATSPITVALAWLRDRPGVAAPILGARTLASSRRRSPARPSSCRARSSPRSTTCRPRPSPTPRTCADGVAGPGLRRLLRGGAVARARPPARRSSSPPPASTARPTSAPPPSPRCRGSAPSGPAGCCRRSSPPGRPTRSPSCVVPAGVDARVAGRAVDLLGPPASRLLRDDPWRLLAVHGRDAGRRRPGGPGRDPGRDARRPAAGPGLVAWVLARQARDGHTVDRRADVARPSPSSARATRRPPSTPRSMRPPSWSTRPRPTPRPGRDRRRRGDAESQIALARYAEAEDGDRAGHRAAGRHRRTRRSLDPRSSRYGAEPARRPAAGGRGRRAERRRHRADRRPGHGQEPHRRHPRRARRGRRASPSRWPPRPAGPPSGSRSCATPRPRPCTGCSVRSRGSPGTASASTAASQRGEEWPLDEDVVVVDEASMLDVELADGAAERLRDGTHLVFVGDAAQLPSIGPGTGAGRPDRLRHACRSPS